MVEGGLVAFHGEPPREAQKVNEYHRWIIRLREAIRKADELTV